MDVYTHTEQRPHHDGHVADYPSIVYGGRRRRRASAYSVPHRCWHTPAAAVLRCALDIQSTHPNEKERARENKPRCAIEVRVYTCVWHRKNVSGSCTRPCLPIINGKRAAPKIKFGYWRVDSTSPKTSKGPRNGGNDAGPPDGPSQKEAVKKVNHFSFF